MSKSSDDKKKILQELEFGQLQENELESLADLINGMRSYSDDMLNLRSTSKEYFHWMYFQNPAGPAIVYRAFHNDKLVSSFAMAPKKMQVGSSIITVGKTMDMFTHPDYQGLGLVKKLTEMVFDDAIKSGISMWYVTPSTQSYPIFVNKWGYKESFNVIYLSALLNPPEILGNKIKPPLLGRVIGYALSIALKLSYILKPVASGYEIRHENTFGPETDDLWNKSASYSTALIRDKVYMTWRYMDNPDTYPILKFYKDDKIRGLIILKQTTRQGFKIGEIVDYICPEDDPQTLMAMIRHALQVLSNDGCVMAQSWAIENTRLENQLRRAGLSFKRKKIYFVLSPDSVYNEFYDKNTWLLTQGDGNDI